MDCLATLLMHLRKLLVNIKCRFIIPLKKYFATTNCYYVIPEVLIIMSGVSLTSNNERRKKKMFYLITQYDMHVTYNTNNNNYT